LRFVRSEQCRGITRRETGSRTLWLLTAFASKDLVIRDTCAPASLSAGFERLFDDESASPKSTRGGSRES
jgi:hypothetical protein